MRLSWFFALNIITYCDAFVYSCNEVKYHLMNTEFEQYSKYAYVAVQSDFILLSLEEVYLQLGKTTYRFAHIAKHRFNLYVENDQEGVPWKIVGDESKLTCVQDFTLVFTSDHVQRVIPMDPLGMDLTNYDSSVHINPKVGFWINKVNAVGNGTFTIYTGAGTGEDEERYVLRTFDCDSIPRWIYTFEVVITLEVDDCNFFRAMEIEMSLDRRRTVNRNDEVLVLISGRSNNLQNLEDKEHIVYLNIGDEGLGAVTVKMDLSFDSNNTGYVGLMQEYAGNVSTYSNGSYTEQFYSNYLEIRWLPSRLQPWELSRNEDFISVEIITSAYNDEYICPDGFSLASSDDDQHWCYAVTINLDNKNFTFFDAVDVCNASGSTLPIVTSPEVDARLSIFAADLEINFQSPWLGILCDEETGNWTWQDGQSVEYNALKGALPETSCLNLGHFTIDYAGFWELNKPNKIINEFICATRALPIGSSSPSTIAAMENEKSPGLPVWAIILIVVFIVFICGGMIAVAVFSMNRIRSLKTRLIEGNLESTLHKENALEGAKKDSEWEIKREFVGIDYTRKLGEGSFGSVYLGHVMAKNLPSVLGRSIAELSVLINNNDSVAVKMMHENAEVDAVNEFRSEIELMKEIGFHDRLVNMLACVTISAPILLISEYCSNGDLLGFMRQRREYMLEHPGETVDAKVITGKKQMAFAIQISYGLEYISSRGFIHRDVAARNIMIDHRETCKIGDFGLGRAVGRMDEIYQAIGRKLPLKWMAPEAIDKYYFSSAGDVWSFGVLLFEIVTLGGNPYADWPTTEILTRLKRGERMDRPDNCSAELFQVMCHCWSNEPSERPTFGELRQQLGEILDEVDQDYYLKLNAHANYYIPENSACDHL